MKNPLILNIRCVCIDEYMELQRIHNNYRKLRSEGEILSIYVGAKRELYGKSKIVDKMLDKVFGDGSKPIPTERIMREEVVGAQGNGDGTITETVERTFVPEAFDGGAEPESKEKSPISEFAIGDRAEEFHYEDEAKPEPKPEEPKPEITLTDVLEAEAEADDPMEAIKTEAEGEPDYGDGQDYNTTYAG